MAPPARAPRRQTLAAPFGDRTRARTAALNQLLLSAVVVIVGLVGFIGGFEGHKGLFFAGILSVFLATAAAIGIPWNRLPAYASASVPVTDIVAITVMRESSTASGFGLLWIFPAMWLAGAFGIAGLVFSVGSITSVYLVSSLAPGRAVTFGTLLLPFVVAAVATTSYITARRTAVQRRLLDNQTQLLAHALARTRQQEEMLTEVIEAVDFGIIRVGRDGRVAVTNDAHGRLQLAAEPGADGAPPPAFVYGRDGITPLETEEQPLSRAMRGEAFQDDVVWFGPPGGDRRALTVTSRRLHDDAGNDVGSIVVSRDVTSELIAIRSRQDLVASVSHELRTPLTSIVGYLELVLEEELSPSARRGLEIAERNANRLLSIVADILTASSSDRSTVELSIRPQRIDVAELVRSSAELHAPRAAERGIRVDTTGLEPAVAWADPSRIRQVLDNLFSNAVKYNRDGGVIEVGTTSDSAHVWVVVRDTGTGIAEAELPRLFDRFFRADSVRNTSTHGSGLGLTIAREIVRSHGGDITVQSKEGIGTTFVVRLPVRSRTSSEEGGAA